MDTNYFQVLRDSVAGRRRVDEQTFASMEILSERLERLKQLDKSFAKVTFSSSVKRLAKQKHAVLIG